MDTLEVYYRSDYTVNHHQEDVFRPEHGSVPLASIQVSDGWQAEMVAYKDSIEVLVSKDGNLMDEYDDLEDQTIPETAYAMRQELTKFLMATREDALESGLRELSETDRKAYTELLFGKNMPCGTSCDYTCCLERSDGWTAMTGAHMAAKATCFVYDQNELKEGVAIGYDKKGLLDKEDLANYIQVCIDKQAKEQAYLESLVPKDPIRIEVLSSPTVWDTGNRKDICMDARFDGKDDNILKYEPAKGAFLVSVMLPGPKLAYYPAPAGSTVHFADGLSLPVLEDKEQQKTITNPTIVMEGKKQQVWKEKPEPELTVYEAGEQLRHAAERFYDTELREGVTMRGINQGALDILREVSQWKTPEKGNKAVR